MIQPADPLHKGLTSLSNTELVREANMPPGASPSDSMHGRAPGEAARLSLGILAARDAADQKHQQSQAQPPGGTVLDQITMGQQRGLGGMQPDMTAPPVGVDQLGMMQGDPLRAEVPAVPGPMPPPMPMPRPPVSDMPASYTFPTGGLPEGMPRSGMLPGTMGMRGGGVVNLPTDLRYSGGGIVGYANGGGVVGYDDGGSVVEGPELTAEEFRKLREESRDIRSVLRQVGEGRLKDEDRERIASEGRGRLLEIGEGIPGSRDTRTPSEVYGDVVEEVSDPRWLKLDPLTGEVKPDIVSKAGRGFMDLTKGLVSDVVDPFAALATFVPGGPSVRSAAGAGAKAAKPLEGFGTAAGLARQRWILIDELQKMAGGETPTRLADIPEVEDIEGKRLAGMDKEKAFRQERAQKREEEAALDAKVAKYLRTGEGELARTVGGIPSETGDFTVDPQSIMSVDDIPDTAIRAVRDTLQGAKDFDPAQLTETGLEIADAFSKTFTDIWNLTGEESKKALNQLPPDIRKKVETYGPAVAGALVAGRLAPFKWAYKMAKSRLGSGAIVAGLLDQYLGGGKGREKLKKYYDEGAKKFLEERPITSDDGSNGTPGGTPGGTSEESKQSFFDSLSWAQKQEGVKAINQRYGAGTTDMRDLRRLLTRTALNWGAGRNIGESALLAFEQDVNEQTAAATAQAEQTSQMMDRQLELLKLETDLSKADQAEFNKWLKERPQEYRQLKERYLAVHLPKEGWFMKHSPEKLLEAEMLAQAHAEAHMRRMWRMRVGATVEEESTNGESKA